MYNADTFSKASSNIEGVVKSTADRAKKNGADESHIVGKITFDKNLTCENYKLTLASSSDAQSIGVKVHKGQKKGTASLNSLHDREVEETVKSALELSSFSLPDPFLNLPEKSLAGPTKPLGFLFDEDLFDVSSDYLKSLMLEAIAKVKAKPKIALERLDVSVGFSFDCLANSHEVFRSEKQSMINWSYVGMAKDGDEVSGMDYNSGFAFKKDGFEKHFFADLDIFCDKVLKNLDPKPCPSYKGPVVFSARAFEEIILGVLLFHASGRSVMDGKSKWTEKKGAKVASESLTIIDNPFDPRLTGATSYDADGLATKKLDIIHGGVLKTFLLDCYSSKKLGTTSNACAGAPFGLNVMAGHTQDKDLTRVGPKQILYVDRFSGNVDSLTGDFSGVAKSSHLYENGQHMHAVTETMIAGNVFDVVCNILALGTTQHVISGDFASPDLVADGVTVSGS
ncbi:MAG: TldD/PmbA family protein [Oligoflexales bacterium]